MGNGQYLVYGNICVRISLEMQGNICPVDFYVYPIWGLDLVLGTQWLCTLGSCLHDHDNPTMKFQ